MSLFKVTISVSVSVALQPSHGRQRWLLLKPCQQSACQTVNRLFVNILLKCERLRIPKYFPHFPKYLKGMLEVVKKLLSQ